MRKLLLLILTLSVPAFAQTAPAGSVGQTEPAAKTAKLSADKAFGYLYSLNSKASAPMRIVRSGNKIGFMPPGEGRSAYSDAYKYGDVVFLHGHLEDEMTQDEWNRYYGIAKWLVEKGFRVIMNPLAATQDIRAAAQDDRTKVIIWSSHASKDGTIYDTTEQPVPRDAFSAGGKNLKQIVFSCCFSELTVKLYPVPATVTSTIHWEGTTNTGDLFSYLKSKRFDPTTLGPNVE